MRTLVSLVLALLIAMVTATPAFARVVLMRASATLADHGELAVEQALRRALSVALDRARVMGLVTMRVERARVLDDSVVVWLIATDEDEERDQVEEADGAAPGRASE